MRAWPLLLLLLAVLPAAALTRGYYVGVIGKYPVQMDLTEDHGLSGVYRYDAVGEALTLAPLALHDRTGYQCMTELDARRQVTGRIIGRFSADRLHYTGTWQSADGTRKLPVSVTRVATYIDESRMINGVTITTLYPTFEEDVTGVQALSERLPNEAVPSLPGSVTKITRAISIVYYTPQLVSLRVETRDAAHADGPRKITAVNYRTDGDTPVLLGLNHLFIQKKTFRDALVKQVRPALAKQKAARGGGALTATQPANYLTFTLSRTAITFLFPPGAAGNASEGEYAVKVPYAALWSYLNPSGPLTAFMGSTGPVPGLARDPVTGLTAHEAVMLGCDKFRDRYCTVNRDSSTAGLVEAMNVYTRLRVTENANQLLGLLPAQRKQYYRASDTVDALIDAYMDVVISIDLGSGTSIISGEAETKGMDALGACIEALRTPTVVDPTARRQTKADLRIMRTQALSLTAQELPPIVDHVAFPIKRQNLLRAVDALTPLCATLPDRAAAAVAAYAAKTIRVEE
jgi:hypothetical protein